ncbi:MAG: hypothetical protein CSA33_01950 [Desulfobulbus propionicus]|nr:MAG: hypothetical protein CSA33_01950 [Desulfobulbus propionicus]
MFPENSNQNSRLISSLFMQGKLSVHDKEDIFEALTAECEHLLEMKTMQSPNTLPDCVPGKDCATCVLAKQNALQALACIIHPEIEDRLQTAYSRKITGRP